MWNVVFRVVTLLQGYMGFSEPAPPTPKAQTNQWKNGQPNKIH